MIADEHRIRRVDRTNDGALTSVAVGVLIASLVAALTLGACGHQQAPPPATEQPDPPSWLVGEVDRTTPAPSPAPMASLAVGDSACQPSTLFLSGGESMRIKNSGTALHSIILAGVEVASVEPGASKVVSVALEPGRYEFSLREDPSTPERLLSRSGTPPAGRRPTSKLTEQEAKWRDHDAR